MTALLALGLLAACAAAQEDSSRANPRMIRSEGILLFYNARGPLSFVTMTPGQLPKGAVPIGEVKGKSCSHGLSVPLSASIRPTSLSGAAGDGGYHKTLEAMRRERPELAGIYDVKVDLHILSILGVYRRQCTEILARGFREGKA